MSLDPGELYTTKVGLLECVRDRLVLTDEGEPDRVCVVPGAEVAWDDCECGQLTVHHTSIVPSRVFPFAQSEGPFTKCAPPWWVVTMVVTVVRCVPTGEGEAPPSCVALDAATVIQDQDIEAMQRGVTCCLSGAQHLIGEHITLGPGGACVGSQLSVQVGFKNCQDDC